MKSLVIVLSLLLAVHATGLGTGITAVTSRNSILCRRFNNRAWYSYEVALIINFSLEVKSILSL